MIADFGQARAIGPNGVTLMPTRMYALCIPPETFSNGRRGTVESDIFQIGMTLYRAVNGEPEFARQFQAINTRADLEKQIVGGKFPRREIFLPHVPDRLRRVIRKALSTDPAKRYPSAAAFSNALAQIPIFNNWATSLNAGGNIDWLASRPKSSDLRVSLSQAGANCDVEIHTLHQGKLRRSKTALWRAGIKRDEAETYLTQLFATLE